MSSLTPDQVRAILSLVIPGGVLVAGMVSIYRSDRATKVALQLTARPTFHQLVKLFAVGGFGLLAVAFLTYIEMLSVPIGYATSLGTILATGILLFGYANVELIASHAEVQAHPSIQHDDGGKSMFESWRRSERRYKVWRCLLTEYHAGTYWALYAVGALFVPGGVMALLLNNLLGLFLLVYMWALGLVSFVAAVLVGFRFYYELNCDNVEGLDAAVDDARSRV